jgi:hypothetical protein
LVAFVVSSLIGAVGIIGIVVFARRRPVGAPLTWGEAIAASTYVFALMFWCYGVIPHAWLTWAGNELGWRTDNILVGWHLPFTGTEGMVEYFVPFVVDYEKIRDVIVVVIYGIFLGLQIGLFSYWQKRGQTKPVELPVSTYGRPLVKQG